MITVDNLLKLIGPLSDNTHIDFYTPHFNIGGLCVSEAISQFGDRIVDRVWVDGFNELLFIDRIALYIR